MRCPLLPVTFAVGSLVPLEHGQKVEAFRRDNMHFVVTLEVVRSIALKLPGVIESADVFGFSVPVKKKKNGLIWLWKERIEHKGPKMPNPSVLAVVVPSLGVKELILSSDSTEFFTEPRYDNFPAVLVRLEAIDLEELEDLII